MGVVPGVLPIILRTRQSFLGGFSPSLSPLPGLAVLPILTNGSIALSSEHETPNPQACGNGQKRLSAQNCSGALLVGERNMSNDARLGLVVGLGLVLAVAVTYFPKSNAEAQPPSTAAPTANSATGDLMSRELSNH